ncbi:MAG TPA: DUF6338 family protein [Armatimonadota bacterium]|nr:DUF6338 family protein [Armatimonadota bacterium]
MSLAWFEVTLYTAVFVLPGFVIYSVVSKLVILGRRNQSTSVLSFLVLTVVNYAIWFIPLRNSITHKWFKVSPGWTELFYILVMLVSPALIGLLMGAAIQKRWLEKLLDQMKLASVDPTPTAWDWVLANKGQEWVIVTLKNGIILYGVHRFASSDPAERDVFLDEVYQVGSDGRWEPVPDSSGVLIKGDEIVSIEFKRSNAGVVQSGGDG